MSSASSTAPIPTRRSSRLPPEVNRIIHVKNLPFKITTEELYDIFGRYGAVRQIRLGSSPDTRGTAFVVYEDIFDAKNAVEHLPGFNVSGRYLIVLYHVPARAQKRIDVEKRRKELNQLKERYGLDKAEEKDEAAAAPR